MSKKFLRRNYFSLVLLVVLSFAFVLTVVNGASTISTNVTTDGTLTVTATSTFNDGQGDYDFRVESDNQEHMFFVDAGNDRVGIASSTPHVALGVVGTTTSSLGVRIGATGSGITQLLFGTCTVTIGSVTASSTAVATCTATGVTTADKVFVTPNITDAQILFSSASSTANNTIQVAVYNAAATGGALNPADNVWSWMAIR